MNWKIDGNEFVCEICGRRSKTRQSITSHIWKSHSNEGLNHNPKLGKVGQHAWNKGLIKTTDDRVLNISNKLLGKKPWLGKHHSQESKDKISTKLSKNNHGGKCKWFDVNGQKVQGTWEKAVAEKLSALGIRWIAHHYSMKYEIDGKIKTYTPDFFLPDQNLFLEIKGFWWGNDKEKMKVVLEQHDDKKIVIIEKDDFEKLLQGELVW